MPVANAMQTEDSDHIPLSRLGHDTVHSLCHMCLPEKDRKIYMYWHARQQVHTAGMNTQLMCWHVRHHPHLFNSSRRITCQRAFDRLLHRVQKWLTSRTTPTTWNVLCSSTCGQEHISKANISGLQLQIIFKSLINRFYSCRHTGISG